MTKEDIFKQEEFLKKEKQRIEVEEKMIAQQEMLKKEIEQKQQMMIKQVVERVKKENEES